MRLLAAVLTMVTIFASGLYGEALLHGCEDLGTVSLSSQPVRQDTVTMQMDAPYVTQGRACLHMYLESSRDRCGHSLRRVRLYIHGPGKWQGLRFSGL